LGGNEVDRPLNSEGVRKVAERQLVVEQRNFRSKSCLDGEGGRERRIVEERGGKEKNKVLISQERARRKTTKREASLP
jgi:hypothetical protein